MNVNCETCAHFVTLSHDTEWHGVCGFQGNAQAKFDFIYDQKREHDCMCFQVKPSMNESRLAVIEATLTANLYKAVHLPHPRSLDDG